MGIESGKYGESEMTGHPILSSLGHFARINHRFGSVTQKVTKVF